jgi:hypothetical protein
MISLSNIHRSNLLKCTPPPVKCDAGLTLRDLLTDPKTADISVSPRILTAEVVVTLISSSLKSWHSTRYRRRYQVNGINK